MSGPACCGSVPLLLDYHDKYLPVRRLQYMADALSYMASACGICSVQMVSHALYGTSYSSNLDIVQPLIETKSMTRSPTTVWRP